MSDNDWEDISEDEALEENAIQTNLETDALFQPTLPAAAALNINPAVTALARSNALKKVTDAIQRFEPRRTKALKRKDNTTVAAVGNGKRRKSHGRANDPKIPCERLDEDDEEDEQEEKDYGLGSSFPRLGTKTAPPHMPTVPPNSPASTRASSVAHDMTKLRVTHRGKTSAPRLLLGEKFKDAAWLRQRDEVNFDWFQQMDLEAGDGFDELNYPPILRLTWPPTSPERQLAYRRIVLLMRAYYRAVLAKLMSTEEPTKLKEPSAEPPLETTLDGQAYSIDMMALVNDEKLKNCDPSTQAVAVLLTARRTYRHIYAFSLSLLSGQRGQFRSDCGSVQMPWRRPVVMLFELEWVEWFVDEAEKISASTCLKALEGQYAREIDEDESDKTEEQQDVEKQEPLPAWPTSGYHCDAGGRSWKTRYRFR